MHGHFTPIPNPAGIANLHHRESRGSRFPAVLPALALGLFTTVCAPVGFAAERPVPDCDQLRASFVAPDHAHWGEVPLWWWEAEAPLLDRAGGKQREYQRLLGPDILDQLRKKIEIMESHRRDYSCLGGSRTS